MCPTCSIDGKIGLVIEGYPWPVVTNEDDIFSEIAGSCWFLVVISEVVMSPVHDTCFCCNISHPNSCYDNKSYINGM